MEKITSFTIDHIKLQPGVYVSRKDPVGDQVITTFDIRMTSPNEEPVMNTAELHAMEHLAATFLRNHKAYRFFGDWQAYGTFRILLEVRSGCCRDDLSSRTYGAYVKSHLL